MVFDPVDTGAVTIEVESATPGTYIEILGLTRLSRRSGRPTRKTSVFMQATQVESDGALDESITLSGIVDVADPGLLRVLAQKAARVKTNFKITYDGTNGFSQLMKIVSVDSDADPDADYTHTMTLEAAGDATPVGTGPVI